MGIAAGGESARWRMFVCVWRGALMNWVLLSMSSHWPFHGVPDSFHASSATGIF